MHRYTDETLGSQRGKPIDPQAEADAEVEAKLGLEPGEIAAARKALCTAKAKTEQPEQEPSDDEPLPVEPLPRRKQEQPVARGLSGSPPKCSQADLDRVAKAAGLGGRYAVIGDAQQITRRVTLSGACAHGVNLSAIGGRLICNDCGSEL